MGAIVRKPKAKQTKKVNTQWWAMGVAVTLTLMLCLTINYRAFSELSGETVENESLQKRIQSVTEENLALQEQIHYLRNDPETVEREAGKFGYRRSKEKVPVPTNK